MKKQLIRPALLIAIFSSLLHMTAAAQEPPIERELQRIQLEVRMESFKHTATEVLETRKHLAMVHEEAEEKELGRRLERLERWQEQLTREIHELAEVIHRGPRDQRRAEVEQRGDRAVPQGHYFLELNFEPQGGQRVRTNVEIHCVNASDKRFIGMAGKVSPMGDRRIQVQLRNEHHAATQIWEAMDDGHWRVMEIPDRGENQVAVPVRDGRVE
jgi:hypothetical protein